MKIIEKQLEPTVRKKKDSQLMSNTCQRPVPPASDKRSSKCISLSELRLDILCRCGAGLMLLEAISVVLRDTLHWSLLLSGAIVHRRWTALCRKLWLDKVSGMGRNLNLLAITNKTSAFLQVGSNFSQFEAHHFCSIQMSSF